MKTKLILAILLTGISIGCGGCSSPEVKSDPNEFTEEDLELEVNPGSTTPSSDKGN